MSKRGFTLIELLASVIILSIIMLIAVPSTLNILDRSRKQQYISDAKKMLTLAEGYLRSHEEIEYPTNGQVLIFRLPTINDGTLLEDPEGSSYSDKSFVAVTRKTSGSNYQYEYRVQLVGVNNTKNRGVSLSTLADLSGDERYNKVEKNINIDINCTDISKKILGSGANCIEK